MPHSEATQPWLNNFRYHDVQVYKSNKAVTIQKATTSLSQKIFHLEDADMKKDLLYSSIVPNLK